MASEHRQVQFRRGFEAAVACSSYSERWSGVSMRLVYFTANATVETVFNNTYRCNQLRR